MLSYLHCYAVSVVDNLYSTRMKMYLVFGMTVALSTTEMLFFCTSQSIFHGANLQTNDILKNAHFLTAKNESQPFSVLQHAQEAHLGLHFYARD